MNSAVVFLSVLALNGPCRSCARVQKVQVVQQKAVVQKVVQQPVVQKTVAVQQPVQYASFMAVQPQSYYAEMVGVRQDNNLTQEFAKLRAELKADINHAASVLSNQITAATGVQPTAEAFGAFDFTSKPDTNTTSTDVVTILNKHCASCHTGNSAKAGIRIFNNDGSLANLSPTDKVLIDYSVYDGRMPKDAPGALTDAEYNILREWVSQDKRIRSALRQ